MWHLWFIWSYFWEWQRLFQTLSEQSWNFLVWDVQVTSILVKLFTLILLIATLLSACNPHSWNAQRKFVMWIKVNFYVFSSSTKTASPSLQSLDITHAGSARQFTPLRDSYLKRSVIKAKLQDWPLNFPEGNIVLPQLFFPKISFQFILKQ